MFDNDDRTRFADDLVDFVNSIARSDKVKGKFRVARAVDMTEYDNLRPLYYFLSATSLVKILVPEYSGEREAIEKNEAVITAYFGSDTEKEKVIEIFNNTWYDVFTAWLMRMSR